MAGDGKLKTLRRVIVSELKKAGGDDRTLTRKYLRKTTLALLASGKEGEGEEVGKTLFRQALAALVESGRISVKEDPSGGKHKLVRYLGKRGREEEDATSKADNKKNKRKKDHSDSPAPTSSSLNSNANPAAAAAVAAAAAAAAAASTASSSSSSSSGAGSNAGARAAAEARAQATGNNSILLFYTYCPTKMTRAQQDEAITHCYKVLKRNNVTGRLRIAREGYNGTLVGPHEGVRAFTRDLADFDVATFGNDRVDFKYVDNLPDSQLLKGLKVFPVAEIVTYGLDDNNASLEHGGKHLSPAEYHAAMANPNSIMIDVRNYNESLIGRFAPPPPPTSSSTTSNGTNDTSGNGTPTDADADAAVGNKFSGEKVLDPCMRRSTEFPDWVRKNRAKLEGKQVLLYCTAGVRCERASAFMQQEGLTNVCQLKGGIHRYLEAFPEDGGFWVGKNYTFDKRFNHGADNAETISHCVACDEPWDRYQAQKKCFRCKMEVIVCRQCQRKKPALPASGLLCPLCSGKGAKRVLSTRAKQILQKQQKAAVGT